MKHKLKSHLLKKITRWLYLTLGIVLLSNQAHAEGSADFIGYPGFRLFYNAEFAQQMKVYAAEGEFINVGASHVGISGGFISVYRPDGTLFVTFDNSGATAGKAIINDDLEEKGGPTGGGTMNGSGYEPGVISVGTGESGVWTIDFNFPTIEAKPFTNILNNAPWTRAANQPTIRRVILAWDITVSKGNAANDGGNMVTGRVYSNEYISILNRNGVTTSPTFFILTKDGYQYEVNISETDPWGFPISCNNYGIVNHLGEPTYSSAAKTDYQRSANPDSWISGVNYLYEPQAEDFGPFINNKIFFNLPDPDMPLKAMVTDIYRMNTHETWLFSELVSAPIDFTNYEMIGADAGSTPCGTDLLQTGIGGNFNFEINIPGAGELAIDFNNDGDFDDAVDRVISQDLVVGANTIFWDGNDGNGDPILPQDDFKFKFRLSLKGGELHVMMFDIENNPGGLRIVRLNGLDSPADEFYYDHTAVGGTVSGGGTEPEATIDVYTYSGNFGNNKMLDYWSYIDYPKILLNEITLQIVDDCGAMPLDSDGDLIPDFIDIDDDNDGVRDYDEYCGMAGGYACLPGGFSPEGDEDGDKVLNYLDADDPIVHNGCVDNNNDGLCDQIAPEYDTDGDNVPDHLDLDSDNDGISDLVEAGHFQDDVDGNGVIDGDPPVFGLNGFYQSIETDDSDLATATYNRWDFDGDNVPDHDDLDSDNDGIFDVAEAGFASSDSNDDGIIDDGAGNVPVVSATGLTPQIDPDKTGTGIPYPPDFDGDTISDWHDLDSDNDGINDVMEAGLVDIDNNGTIGLGIPGVNPQGLATGTASNPVKVTSFPIDKDMDGIPDWHDLDSDNDGINDVLEGGNTDPDNDGTVGTGIPVVNLDGQPAGATSDPLDTDRDGYPDFRDLDSDNDGINDVVEADFADPDGDGIVGMGVPTVNIKGQVGMPTSNPTDTDMDGYPDFRDLDSDNDGINDVIEGGNPDPDGDGIIETGMPVVNDNGQANGNTSSPLDTDDDGTPDYRDLDSDSDGVPDVIEGGNPDPDLDGIIGTGTPIVNQNGQAIKDQDGTQLSPTSDPTDTDGDGIPDFRELDSDDDGIPDEDECDALPCRDGDNDGMPDFQDIDRDNDGIVDSYECENSTPCTDTDMDGIPDVDDLDSDNDGLADSFECPDGADCPDFDGDGTPDFRDLDSDGDGYPDQMECPGGPTCPDLDDDGNPDWLDNLCNTPLNQPTLLVNNPICTGDLIKLAVQETYPAPALASLGYEADFVWMNGNGDTIAQTNERNFELLSTLAEAVSPFTVQVTVRDCASPNSEALEVESATPETPEIDAENNILCEGGTLVLQTSDYGTDMIEYEWFLEDNSVMVTSEPELRLNGVDDSAAGEYKVLVRVNGCPSDASTPTDIQVYMNDFIRNATNSTENLLPACESEIVELDVPFVENATYEWVGPDGFVNSNHHALIYDVTEANAGKYYASIMIPGCPTIISEHTEVFIFNNADVNQDEFTINPNTTLEATVVDNDDVFNIANWTTNLVTEPRNGDVTLSPNGEFIYSPDVNYKGDDYFTYELCNDECPESCQKTEVRIRIFDAETHFNCYVPNVITPNGDGANDAFLIECLEDFPDHEMLIFNRWGDKVYNAAPYYNDWEGTFLNKPLPAGTYFYMIKLNNNSDDILQGFFTIVR